jgi:hypothetical protein
LHKDIESDLVKRSSLAQTLIKKLYREIQENKKSQPDPALHTPTPQSSRRSSAESEGREREQEEAVNKLKF